MFYKIWFKQIDKTTGRVIGLGQSYSSWRYKEGAKQFVPDFEFENEFFKQEVVGIYEKNPFSPPVLTRRAS